MNDLQYSSKNKVACALFCFFLGIFGAHRFYVKKTGTAVIMLLLCCAGIYSGGWVTGISGVWAIVDFIMILMNKFKDGEGKIVGLKNKVSTEQPVRAVNVTTSERPILPSSDTDMIKCGNCGKDIPANTKFCKYCGSPLTKKCGKCNTDNPMEYKFCKECGNSL